MGLPLYDIDNDGKANCEAMTRDDTPARETTDEAGDPGSSQAEVEAAIQRLDPNESDTATDQSTGDARDHQEGIHSPTTGVFASTRATLSSVTTTDGEATQAEVEAAVRERERTVWGTVADGGSTGRETMPSRPAAGSTTTTHARTPATLAMVVLCCLLTVGMIMAAPIGLANTQEPGVGLTGGAADDLVTTDAVTGGDQPTGPAATQTPTETTPDDGSHPLDATAAAPPGDAEPAPPTDSADEAPRSTQSLVEPTPGAPAQASEKPEATNGPAEPPATNATTAADDHGPPDADARGKATDSTDNRPETNPTSRDDGHTPASTDAPQAATGSTDSSETNPSSEDNGKDNAETPTDSEPSTDTTASTPGGNPDATGSTGPAEPDTGPAPDGPAAEQTRAQATG